MRFTTVEDWLNWQSNLHFKSIDLGLERVATVWKQLHPAFLSAFVISVAGTNGKGSSIAMLESILLADGFTVGCYTSPHLLRFNERIKINGIEIDDEALCKAFAAIDDARQDISLSYFEFATLAALFLFDRAGVDVMLLEVGLGGRLDAVNIIDAQAALITNISIDHQDWLGDNREAIGFEKAGILRKNQNAVFSGPDIPKSILQRADTIGCHLLIADKDFHVKKAESSWDYLSHLGDRFALPFPSLKGDKQLENAAGVVALLQACKSSLAVSMDALRTGLLNAQIKGRFQLVQAGCSLILDVAHNEASMKELANNLTQYHQQGRIHLIIGMLKDKDISNSLSYLMPLVDRWHLVSTEGDRGLSAVDLEKEMIGLNSQVKCVTYDKVRDAYESVLQKVLNTDTIVITGSFLMVGSCSEFLD